MTVRINEGRAAIERALVCLAELCGDEQNIWFGEADLADEHPLRTTISELEDAGSSVDTQNRPLMDT